MSLLPVSSHVGPLQFAVPERHLAGVARILVELGRSGNRNGLWPRRSRSTRGYSGHAVIEKVNFREGKKKYG